MADKFTSIRLPGVYGSGIAEWGVKTPAEMIEKLREHARIQNETWHFVLKASDLDFYITTYEGVHTQRNRKVLQMGKGKTE